MRGRPKKLLALVLAVFLMAAIFPLSAYADEDQESQAKRWNIMLVVDGSGSLFATDANKLRYDAIAAFLDIIQSDGNNVGAIVFSANPTAYDSDEAMRRGIMLDTGLIPLDKSAPTGGDAKAYLVNAIRTAGVSVSRDGATDIGTALLVAQEHLSSMNNGNDSAIFLFTDGETDLNTDATRRKSGENLKTATSNMYDQGIKLCGVFLNKDGKSQSKEVRSIVCQANGISDSSLNLGDMYVEITDAASCADSTDKFMSMLGFSIPEGGPGFVIYDSADMSFRIPGVGVEEANIRLRTVDGVALPAGVDVTITAPDGTVYSGASAAAICSTGKTYRVYKISNPMSGTWQIHIEVPEGNQVGISYTPVFSIYIGAKMNIEPAADKLHVNMSANVSGVLTRGDTEITDANAYKEYKCVFTLTDVSSGEKTEHEIQMNGNGKFIDSIPLDTYGIFDAQIRFECDDVSAVSDIQTLDLTNRAPNGPSYLDAKVKYGLFQKKIYEIDLSDEFVDPEDGGNITLSVDDAQSTCNTSAVSIDGLKLNIESKNISDQKKSYLYVDVSDTLGASSEISINITHKNMTLPIILAFIGAAVAIFLIVLFITRVIIQRLDGECTLEFSCKDKLVDCLLPLPGSECKRHTNLATMIAAGRQELKEGCRQANVSIEDAESALQEFGDLSKVKVSVVNGKDGRKLVAKLRVCQSKAQVLYNSQMDVDSNGVKLTIGYYAKADGGADESGMFDFDDDSVTMKDDDDTWSFFDDEG